MFSNRNTHIFVATRRKSENAQCLALAAIANVGGVEFAGNLATEVSKLLTARYAKCDLLELQRADCDACSGTAAQWFARRLPCAC